MKIAYIITRSDWGGAQAHLYDIMKFIKSHTRHECCLIIGEQGLLADKTRQIDIPVTIVSNLVQPIDPFKDVAAIKDTVAILKKIKPDIIHLHSSKAGIVGRIAGRLTGIPAIFTAHGWAFTEGVSVSRQRIFLPIERFMARYTSKIICVSEYDRHIALEKNVGDPNKLIAIHNGIPDAYPHQSVKDASKIKCIMVARFSTQKDYGTLLQAVHKMLPGSDLKFDLVGQGELLESTKQLASQLNVNEMVSFLGPRRDVPDLLVKSDIFLLISNYEGFPISILEAMRASLPVIASDVGGVKEAVIDGVTGFLIPRGDSEKLKSKLELLTGNPQLRMNMGMAGRERYLKYFTDTTMLKKTVAVYESVEENIYL
ncbi:glycosyltransferase family 4 protein [Aneurinibacillus sp. Ricciae_BoGa-3]|uniref:glycosyltransferase family 4 protein n=1 Tax=Aneurinibacillus sp. Ricciae_BoGa-3 TaxID=3022697 RepID=UPI002340F2B4|nr:glycosyltransferase family 4 protein [Aneurinibacillus sp. Ricciae_BoGa-3]WCK54285.1 glycosyltransferase family 4 protein [Aneurinibacillus sp. Ricciae_BoGa-3]